MDIFFFSVPHWIFPVFQSYFYEKYGKFALAYEGGPIEATHLHVAAALARLR
jgi:hypothetical protein